MSDQPAGARPSPGGWRQYWGWLSRPSERFGVLTLFLVGAVGGVLAWGAFNTFMEFTNTPVFCVSCHEMERNPYAEYKTTIHYANRSGVSATCADCHVPREWTAKVLRKIHATNELFHKLAGTIATPEKFEAKRKVL
ncbi:MAG: Denitrification system component NirT, partial [Alphaproteobacteria bacterium]|nr:Denitrification system component NirT [Alphaproteobacteria bacterium]